MSEKDPYIFLSEKLAEAQSKKEAETRENFAEIKRRLSKIEKQLEKLNEG